MCSIYIPHLIHPSVAGASVAPIPGRCYNTLMNIEVHVVPQISAFIFSGHTTTVELLDQIVVSYFQETPYFFSVTALTYTPRKSVERFPFLHTFANIYYL